MLEFLNNIELVAPVEQPREKVSRKLEYNPTNGADIRLFRDGRVFPSLALIEEYNLEYVNKGEQSGNGFDVFSSKDWEAYPKNAPGHAVFIASIGKDKPKVDMFSSTKYNEDGTPVSKVADQAAKTFGVQLINMLRDVYGLELSPEETADPLFGDNGYVDLRIIRTQSLSSPNGIYYIPKKVSKGADAGTIKPQRRENISVHPLVVFTPAMGEATRREENSSELDTIIS